MGGKKMDRKKQSLLSRSTKRKASIKKLSRKPVIKHVDVDAIKESFKNASKAQSAKKKLKAEDTAETGSKTSAKDSKTSKRQKTAKEKTKG